MFSKTADQTPAPPRAPAGATSNTRSVLGADLKITGDIRSSGSVELLGEVEGTIQAQSLIIGGDGLMSGDISADTVEIKGRLSGQIASQSLTLRAAAQVTGNVAYSTLVIESGAQIEGRFTRNKD
ncbi:bactofilin family protein [Tabrizicola oligotrophica]|uniref:Polymer-forming cytoskeletal protein n=1 Tax=Tabrizicola oligotrophica TaxID=2710650 RepID=A0A6M0QXB1_9RHOB|nr:polymer-forming cytoskeletal protein [Tabrizicola oligotrophica]NEY92089.1 polymer-forming cytoskeletal protein [Tabrizicola oligotrophica]